MCKSTTRCAPWVICGLRPLSENQAEGRETPHDPKGSDWISRIYVFTTRFHSKI